MNRIEQLTKELIDAIEHSSQYENYEKIRQQLSKAPLLKERVDEFRKKNYDLQNSHMDIFDEAEKLQREYQDILNNRLVRSYLDAENAICRVIQQINWQILENLEIEAEFEGKQNENRTDERE